MKPSIFHLPPARIGKSGMWEGAATAWSLLWLAAMVLAAMVSVGCRSPAPLAPVSVEPPAQAEPTPICSGDACLQQATALDRQRDYLGARDALKNGCETGSIDACARLGRGAYLLKEEDLDVFTKKGCLLGDFASCVLTCDDRDDRRSTFEFFQEEQRDCPDPRANLHACQRLEAAKAEYEIAAFCADLAPVSPFSSPEQRCPDTGSVARCELRWMINKHDTEEATATLCRRGSAWACSRLLRRRCKGSPCKTEDLADPTLGKEGAELLTKVEQLCQEGSLDACLVLPDRISTRELISFCRKGSKTACERLYDPKDAALTFEARCLHGGDEGACHALDKEVRGDSDKLFAVFIRMCTADFSVCLQPRWYPAKGRETGRESRRGSAGPEMGASDRAPAGSSLFAGRPARPSGRWDFQSQDRSRCGALLPVEALPGGEELHPDGDRPP